MCREATRWVRKPPVESVTYKLDGSLRHEVLNVEWFATTRQAQTAITQGLRQYIHIRPHHSLGMRPLVPETLSEKSPQGGAAQGS